jgi:hypothetical protein
MSPGLAARGTLHGWILNHSPTCKYIQMSKSKWQFADFIEHLRQESRVIGPRQSREKSKCLNVKTGSSCHCDFELGLTFEVCRFSLPSIWDIVSSLSEIAAFGLASLAMTGGSSCGACCER